MLGSHPTSAQQYKSTICNGTVVTYSPIKHKERYVKLQSVRVDTLLGKPNHRKQHPKAQDAKSRHVFYKAPETNLNNKFNLFHS